MPHAPAPMPSLAPGETALPTSWDCDREVNAVGAETGSHCVTLTYAVQPAPDPVVTTVSQVTYACQGPAAPDGSCLAVLHPQQFTGLGFGLVLVVLLLSALVVAQIRRVRA